MVSQLRLMTRTARPSGTHVPNASQRSLASTSLFGHQVLGLLDELDFCAALALIADAQLAENLFMSRPALTQSFISVPCARPHRSWISFLQAWSIFPESAGAAGAAAAGGELGAAV